MDRKVLTAAIAALAMGPMGGGAEVLRVDAPTQAPYLPMGSGSPGKGKGRRPRHSSARFVAQDKREARKARNRSRR